MSKEVSKKKGKEIDKKVINHLEKMVTKYEATKNKWVIIANEMNNKFNTDYDREYWRNIFRRKLGDQSDLKKNYFDQQQRKLETFETEKERLLECVKRPRKLDELVNILNLPKATILGLVHELRENDRYEIVILTDFDGDTIIKLQKATINTDNEYQHSLGGLKKFKFLVLSDTHLGSKVEQLSFVNYLYDYAHENGITHIYHCGDITDGYYKNRAEQVFGLHKHGFEQQLEYVAKCYPEKEGITTYFITGNHDDTHVRNGGANIGKRLNDLRDDMVFLGDGRARIHLTDNFVMEMFHPLDGSSYAKSYAGQKYIESLNPNEKPNIIFTGHHHKSVYFYTNDVHYFEVPSTCMRSDWEYRKRISNDAGAWVVELEIDEEGFLTELSSKLIMQKEYVKDDYKNYTWVD